MKRVGGWLGAGRHNSASTQSLSALDEPQALKDAMAGVIYILSDDVETADVLLSKGNSPFHKLGKGVVAFLRAVLGFEPEMIKIASSALDAAETAASQHRASHRDSYQSPIYPPGSEYALAQAQSQLMGAVVAVLSESLTESIRGFYKLRKAYITLQEISVAEKKFIDSRRSVNASNSSIRSSKQSLQSSVSGTPSKESQGLASQVPTTDDDDLDFVDADEVPQADTPKEYQGHVEPAGLSSRLEGLSIADGTRPVVQQDGVTRETKPLFEDEPEYEELTKHPVDLFIHSGMNLCLGLLLLLLSLIPPAFSKLLYIVGFKGDRDQGLTLLWRSIRYSEVNGINGAIAGLVTLGYYNGMVGFCDIVSEDAYPKEKCKALLSKMRVIYPNSRLWMLEEARMAAGEKRLEEAVDRINAMDNSPLAQIEALQWFERSLNCMCLHRYQDCADGFLKCVTLNNWSHGLYYYIAGVCHVELYRQAKSSDPAQAKKHADKATELLRGVPARSAKKRLMARQLPFDAFVTRKIAKWEERATQRNVDFIDAVGVAPVEEMIYFWNGYKRMRPEHLEKSLQTLAWNEDVAINPNWSKEPLDERAILTFLRAVTLSRSNKTEVSKELLRADILSHDWPDFKKGASADNWTLPIAHYEMAVNCFMECGGEDGSPAELRECSTWLEKAARWESYDLDARVGLKITTARDTLRKCGVVAS